MTGYGVTDNVTINGFEITGALSNNAIYCGGDGPSYLDIKYNYIHNIGVDRGSGNVYAINYRVNNPSPTDVNFSDNFFTNVLNTTSAALGHSAAIWVGQSTANGTVSNLTIERNIISHIMSGQTDRNADGISIQAAWGVGTGKVEGAIIKDNRITDITGGIAMGVNLSGKAPETLIKNNFINNISGSASEFGISVPATNNEAGTVEINENSITNVDFAIFNGTASTINSTCNWWGTEDKTEIAPKILGPVNWSQFLVVNPAGDDYPWDNVNKYSCSGSAPYNEDTGNVYATIQEAIIDANPGDVIVVPSGTYAENVNDVTGVKFSVGTSQGSATITGTLTLDEDSVLEIEIFADDDYDTWTIQGDLTLNNAKLEIVLKDEYKPDPGKVFNIITYEEKLNGELNTPMLIEANGSYFVLDYGSGTDDVITLTTVTPMFKMEIKTTGD